MTTNTWYSHYVLVVLTAVFMLNLVDRGLMTLLIEPIRHDLGLSDTQLGFVTGIAFALFYATLGIPLARWADRGNRARIASLSIGFWGLAVMASFFIANYAQLVVARIVAAVGEAGCKPPTYSLVGDYFILPTDRTRAMGIYWLGSPVAAVISLFVGGWLYEYFGWRTTFLIMGIPGILLAVLVWTTIREARPRTPPKPATVQPRLLDVVAILWARRSSRYISLSLILVYALAYGMAPWYGAFLIRSHGMETGQVGMTLGLVFGASGAIGIWLGGYVTTQWLAANEPAQVRMSAATFLALVPCFILFLLTPDRRLAIATLFLLQLVFSIFYAPTYALLQRLVPDDIRATSLSVIMLFANLIGMGAGPQLVGISSDLLRSSAGADSLRYAMLILSLVALATAILFLKASRHVARDLADAERNKPTEA